MSNYPNYNPYNSPNYVPPQYGGGMGNLELQASAQKKLMGPAIALVVVSVISILHRIVDLVLFTAILNSGANAGPQAPSQPMIVGAYVGDILIPILNIIVIVAAFQMWNVKAHSLAMTGAVLAVIPLCSPCLVLGIPFGIWALLVLNDPQVKAAFR